MIEGTLNVRRNARGVQLATSSENIVEVRQAFAVQGLVKAVPTPPFIDRMSNRSN